MLHDLDVVGLGSACSIICTLRSVTRALSSEIGKQYRIYDARSQPLLRGSYAQTSPSPPPANKQLQLQVIDPLHWGLLDSCSAERVDGWASPKRQRHQA